MLIVANQEAWPGFQTSVDLLKSGSDNLSAMSAALRPCRSTDAQMLATDFAPR